MSFTANREQVYPASENTEESCDSDQKQSPKPERLSSVGFEPRAASHDGQRNDRIDELVKRLAGKKIGLVLAGGGGKGAYQAGCLDYLRSQGISSYHVIAGASVGSLNGVAAACGKIKEIVKVWEQISLRKVLVPSWRLVPFLAGTLIMYAFKLFGAIMAILLGLGLGILISTFSPTLAAIYFVIGAFVLLAALSNLHGLLGVPKAVVARPLEHLLPRYASLAKPHPLRKLIHQVLLNDSRPLEFACPIYATLTMDDRWFDPDSPSFSDFTGIKTSFSHPDFNGPIKLRGVLPKYVDLRNVSEHELLDYLLASAALPIAFRRVLIAGHYYSDGGLIDNEPLSKVLEYDCDIVVVIYLNSRRNLERSLEHIPRLRRAVRLATMPLAQLHSRYIEWVRRPEVAAAHGRKWKDYDDDGGIPWYCHLDYIPEPRDRYRLVPLEPLDSLPELIEVVPSQKLGGLFRGTLNFSKRKARRLVRLGRLDMERALFGSAILGAREDDQNSPAKVSFDGNLASAYEAAGQHGMAVPLYERTLKDCERVLGPEHQLTLVSCANVAFASFSAGLFGRAVLLYEKLLTSRDRLNEDQHDVVAYRANLAFAYMSVGRLHDAIALYEQILIECDQLRCDAFEILGYRAELASGYKSAGQLDKAIALYEHNLSDGEELYPDDSMAIKFRDSLASSYMLAGRFDEAISLYERTLTDSERMFGPDDADTLISGENLAAAFVALVSRGNLATALGQGGRLDEAIALYEQTMAASERVLGRDHSTTLIIRANVVSAYESAGRLDEAIALRERNLAYRERLRPDDPLTLASRANLASAYRTVGRLGEAIPLYERNLTESERVFGPDHPNAQSSRANLVSAYESAGRLDEAIALRERHATDSSESWT